MQHFLETRSVSVESENNIKVLNDLSCRFRSGELSVITGQSGSGKTILLKALRALVKPTEGKVLIDGQAIPLLDPALSNVIAFVPQNPLDSIVGSTVVEDALLCFQSGSESQRHERAIKLLELFELETVVASKCRDLPFGKQKLLTIATATFGEPAFLLVDDPFAGADLSSTKLILKQLLRLKEQGCSIIVATTDIERVLAHADHMILLKDGRNIADALPERVLPFLEAHGMRKPSSKLQDMTWLDR